MAQDATAHARTIRIGCGAGFSGDRVDPAEDLARRGALDYLFFECLAERTLAAAHVGMAEGRPGHDPHLSRRLTPVLAPCREAGTRILTNMGSADPMAGGEAAAEIARGLGLQGLRIAVVTGDDVAALLTPDMKLMDAEGTLGEVGLPMIGANAYLGAAPLVDGLAEGADLVITGRIADPALALAPLIHEFGWGDADWSRLGAGTLVGHLLECASQITGGYFADPGRKDVAGMAWLGYPLAEVGADGAAVITKLPDTGGLVDRRTVLEQMLYEVHDPAAYLTPDVTADFSGVEITQAGTDRVSVHGASGHARPEGLKVTVGFAGGFLGEGEISYAGPGAAARARLAGEVIRTRMVELHGCQDPIRVDLLGLGALLTPTEGAAAPDPDWEALAPEVRLRVAVRSRSRELAETLAREVEALWCAGPAGGGGARGRVTQSVVTRSVLIDRARVRPQVKVITA